ncbi:MAG: hypothetical protein GXY83_44060 [Rhodopirellula sp.]|nr:hypothetical protein [Rhodopirellula sp.]
MIAVPKQDPQQAPTPAWHDRFLAMLPAIREQTRFAFKHMPPQIRRESIDEVAANALVAYARLVELGKEDLAYPTPLALYGIAHVRCGRQVGRSRNSCDVLSRYARRKNGFIVERLDRQNHETSSWAEAVVEDSRTPVADQAAFRIDFPEWLGLLSNRGRRVAEALAVGERTKDVAKRFEISPGRISQMRREFYDSWQEFHGEVDSAATAETRLPEMAAK